MPSLVEQTQKLRADQAEGEASKLAEAKSAFARLLTRADDPEPGDAAELSEVLNTLGLTERAVENHLAELRRFKHYRDRHGEREAAQAEMMRIRAEWKATEKRANEEIRLASVAYGSAEGRVRQCLDAGRQATLIGKRTPLLFDVSGPGLPKIHGETDS